MDNPSTPSPSIRAPRWPWILAWLLLTIYFVSPPREAFDQTLDNSNYATYTYFLTHNLHWGSEVLPMPGPLGFLIYGHTYSGELYGVRLIGDLLLKVGFVILLLRLFQRAGPGVLRWLWLAVVVLLVPTVDDLFHDFAILLSTLVLLAELDRRLNRWTALAGVLLGALTLIKGTHPLTTAACFSAVLLQCILERRWRTIGLFSLTYLGSAAGFWLLCGQNLLHLPAYLHAMLELAAGYNAVMGLDESALMKTAGLTLAGGMGLVFFWALAGTRHSRTVIALLVMAGFSFIKWKHGYVRADGHVFIFFTSVPVVVLTLALATYTPLLGAVPSPFSAWRRGAALALFTTVAGLGIIGASEFSLLRVMYVGIDAPPRFRRNLQYLLQPAAYRAKFDAQLEQSRRVSDTPQIRQEIGTDTVDFFGNEEGLLLLNRFNYHPRPMGGGTFNVFTPWLQKKNEAFVHDPGRAPAWEVLKLETLDDRLPAADDPLTLRAILELYTPVLIQRDYLLLKHRTSAAPAAPVVLETRHVSPGEMISVPAPGAGRLLLFTLDAPLSLAGKVRSFLYRPPELKARVFSPLFPVGHQFKIKPTLVQNPVILSPLLADTLDFIRLFGEDPGDTVRSLQLEPEPGFETGSFSITFYSAPRPPKPEHCDINELITYLEYPLYNRRPIELVTQETGIREKYNEPVTIVHAPGSITWDLQPGDQQVIFNYGIMPQAYLDGGQTDGVEFNVEVIWPPNDGRILFKRLVKPLTAESDRGMQFARVFLPPYERGARLRIRTDPGPDHNGAYDQSYVTHLQIKRVALSNGSAGDATAGLVPEQFNGLGAVPANGRLPKGSIASIGSRPVYLIHAPDEVVLNIPTEAREIDCEIGLLPGAYTGGGNTDGVGYTFTVLRPDGTRQVIGQRYLDPRGRNEDRGPQYMHLALPASPAGTQLSIATDVGPHNDRSWDHSYVAGVTFR